LRSIVVESVIVSLAEAKARLSELTELAARGETIVITKRGKPVVQMTASREPRRPVDLAALKRLTQGQPRQPQGAGEYMRTLREQARY
jgi:prevent-host-death family protein